MKRRFRIVLVLSAVATLLASVLLSNLSMVSAVVPPHLPTSSSALIINPRVNALLNPGQTITGHLQVSNQDSDAPLNLTLRVIDFTYTNETGTPKLFTAANAPQTTWSLKPYLSIPTTINVPPSGSKTFAYTIKVPPNLGAGSYYSAIEYASGLGDSGNVGLSAAGVTLVFVTVSGQAKENMTLEKLGAYNETSPNTAGNFTGYITTTKPNSIAFKITNHGNVVESPAGSIEIKKWGKHYASIDNINPNSLLTLIGQTRLYVPCIKNQVQVETANPTTPVDANTCVTSGLSPGHYSASLSLYYGQNGNVTQEIVATASFWYIPGWLLIIILIVLAYLIYKGVRIYRKFKNGNSGGSRGGSNTYRFKRSSGRKSRFRR